MKHFTTELLSDGLIILKMKLSGCSKARLHELLVGAKIIGYAMPAGHSFSEAWLFRLIFDNGCIVEFSSSCSALRGWQEIGSINIKIISAESAEPDDYDGLFIKTIIGGLVVLDVICLVYADTEVYSECGLVFELESGDEVAVAAGISPGSTSISGSFADQAFRPEFDYSLYKKLSLDRLVEASIMDDERYNRPG